MRALVVGPVAAWSVADVYRGWINGLAAAGVDVYPLTITDRWLYYFNAVVLDENDQSKVVKSLDYKQAATAVSQHILAAAYVVDPDVVFIIHGASIDPAVIAKLRCKVVLVLTESPYEDEVQAAVAYGCQPDMILLNDPTHQGVFDQIAPSFYVPHAYDPAVHHPGPSRFKHDVCFVATGFANRVEWLERVDWDGIDLALAGEWGCLPDGHPLRKFLLHPEDPSACLDNVDTAELYRGCAAGFNVYRYEQQGERSKAEGWAAGPRELEMAASGLWFCRQPRPESDELFPMLPTFTDPGELGDLIWWAIDHPDERQAAVDAARAAIADRTFANHAKRALARLDL